MTKNPKNHEYYERWKAKKLAQDPYFFHHNYQRQVALYGKKKLNEMSTKWQKNHPEYNKQWRANHVEYHAVKSKEWRLKNKKRHMKIVVKWSSSHPEAIQAHYVVSHGRGKLDPVPLAEWCETCPENDMRKALHGHHPDYNYPRIIVSCCRVCHYSLNKSTVEITSENSMQKENP